MEKHADSAIGNVTGSNSVNVFLGLGLAWVIASIYWTSKVNMPFFLAMISFRKLWIQRFLFFFLFSVFSWFNILILIDKTKIQVMKFHPIFFQGVSFEVPAGSLGFSVVIFTICAVVTLILIVIRRYVGVFGNAELGGPKTPKMISGIFMISLWLVYVLVASLQTYEYIEGF